MGRIVAEHWVSAELARVFAFFSDPYNLPRIMPAQMGARIESVEVVPRRAEGEGVVVQSGPESESLGMNSVGMGSVVGGGDFNLLIRITFLYVPLLPLRGRWVAEIYDHAIPWYFTDRQRSGPMKSWRHRHSFRPETRNGIPGTVVRDEVEYELPFGVLGKLADVFFEPFLRLAFTSRQRHLEEIFSSK